MMFQNPSTCFNPFWTVGQHFDEIKRISRETGVESEKHEKFKIKIQRKKYYLAINWLTPNLAINSIIQSKIIRQ